MSRNKKNGVVAPHLTAAAHTPAARPAAAHTVAAHTSTARAASARPAAHRAPEAREAGSRANHAAAAHEADDRAIFPDRAGTRDRLLRMLLTGEHSVTALAASLGVTKNAVRAQLLTLEKEGLVAAKGEERTTRRPSALYGLASGAESSFSRAYPAAFSRLIRVLSRRLSAEEFVRTMRELGRAMAAMSPKADGDTEERIEAARRRLSLMGSATELDRSGGKLILSTDTCPIGEATAMDERCCLSMAAMIEEITGLPVVERCDHGAHPHCRFEIRPGAVARAASRAAAGAASITAVRAASDTAKSGAAKAHGSKDARKGGRG